MRVLIDVDGVVADLMGGFEHFIRERHGLELYPREITTFHIVKSPAHEWLHAKIDLDTQLADFLAHPNCYGHVDVIDGSQIVIDGFLKQGFEIAFITATLKESPESYAPKFRWLAKHFPGVPVISCPSGQKHWLKADFGIDDRFDTCQRWSSAGTTPLLFRQPWNEAPEGVRSFNWWEIADELYSR